MIDVINHIAWTNNLYVLNAIDELTTSVSMYILLILILENV